MRLLPLITFLLMIVSPLQLNAETKPPQSTLDAYFQVLTSQNISNLSELLHPRDMGKLKMMMDGALQAELKRDGSRLQDRFFGRAVTAAEIEAVPSSFYLDKLAAEIQRAANMQKFFIAKRDILGRIDEDEDQIHYVVRLHMAQDDKTTSDLRVYTLLRDGETWKLEFPPIIKQTLTILEGDLQRPGR